MSNSEEIKDINVQLQEWSRKGLKLEQQKAHVDGWLQNSQPFLLVWAEEIGQIVSVTEKNEVLNKFFKETVNRLSPEDRAGFKDALCDALKIKSTQWNDRMRALTEAAKTESDEDKIITKTVMGGWFPDDETENSGWLLEPFYDRKVDKTRWAYARISDMEKNQREIDVADYVTIGDVKYEPLMDENIKWGTIILASGLGPLRTTSELIKEVEAFVRKHFLMDEASRYKLSATYAIFTWLYDCFDALNFLRAMGGSGSGKSDLMYLIGLCSYRLMVTLSVSSTASYKGLAHLYKGTLFIDEAQDLMKKDDGTMRSLLKGRATKRYANVVNMMEVHSPNGKTFVPSTSQVYGPTLITMYGAFDDAGIENRCVSFALTQRDTLELDKVGIEPGYYPPELDDWAERIRGMLLHWRLKTWQPKIELTLEEREKYKLTDPLVSPRVNQVMRPMKVLAVKEQDMDLLKELQMIGQANYEDEMTKRASSFEAIILRAVIAANTRDGYADKVKTGRVKKFGVVRHILYKDLAVIANEVLDAENLGEGAAEDKKKGSVKTQTIGLICRETFRMPVDRTSEGWVVVLDQDKIELAMLRYGLNREDPSTEAVKAVDEQLGLEDGPVAGHYDEQSGDWTL